MEPEDYKPSVPPPLTGLPLGERRSANGEAAILGLITSIHHTLNDLKKIVDDHVKKEPEEIAKQIKEMVTEGFPDGLPNHKVAHQSLIDQALDRRQLFKKVRETTVSGVVWAVVIFVGFSLWEGLRAKLGLPPGVAR